MNATMRPITVVGLVGTLLVGHVCLQGVPDENQGRQGQSGLWSMVETEQGRHDRLEVQGKMQFQRLETKNRIAALVADGRMPLLEAAARFRDLDHQPPEFQWDQFRLRFPGNSDDERHCWEVIAAIPIAGDPGTETLEVVERLEAELREHLARREVFHLPESGS